MRKAILLVLLLILPAWASEAQQQPKLDTTTFVTIGEGLAAGLADFSLRDSYQQKSFPAVIAQQIGTAFPLPLIQPPGIASVPGFPEWPVAVPGPLQTTVRKPFPPPLFVLNLAVPGHHLSDAINLRPTPPLVIQSDAKQTVTNLLLGFPALILGTDKPLWSQLEYAVAMNPTLVLVELGYTEVLEAAVAGDPSLLPTPTAFSSNYTNLLKTLQSTFAQVITTTIPNPFDTGYFSPITVAANLAGVPASSLVSQFGLGDQDLLTPQALMAIGAGETTLPARSVMSAATAANFRNLVNGLNAQITAASQQAGATVYDLNALLAGLRGTGLAVGNLTLTANYLGGLYSLSGSYPGQTGQAVIANGILTLINQKFGTSFPLVNLATVAAGDPAVRMIPTPFGGVGH